MIQVTVHGFIWPLVYWLLVTLGGLVVDVVNIRHELMLGGRTINGEDGERPLRRYSLAYLIVHSAVALAGVSVLLFGLDLQQGALKRQGLTFTFADFGSEVFVVTLSLLIPTIPAAIAVTLYFLRWWPARAINGGPDEGA